MVTILLSPKISTEEVNALMNLGCNVTYVEGTRWVNKKPRKVFGACLEIDDLELFLDMLEHIQKSDQFYRNIEGKVRKQGIPEPSHGLRHFNCDYILE